MVGLEVPREQRVFGDRLWRKLGIDAGLEPRKQQSLDAVLESSIDNVRLNAHVVAEEVDRVGAVRHDAAHLGGGEHHVARLGLGEEGEGRVAVLEVQFGRGRPTRFVKPAPSSRRQMAEPTSPRCPAT